MRHSLKLLLCCFMFISSGCEDGCQTPTPDFAKTWAIQTDGEYYGMFTFTNCAGMSNNSDAAFVRGGVQQSGLNFTIVEEKLIPPPEGGLAVTETTTYSGTFAADKKSFSGTYERDLNGVKSSGTFTGTIASASN